MFMMYDFYRKLARILAKDNEEELFQYIIHSMDDDGGFLRSRYCYWSKELPNQKNGREIKTALVASSEIELKRMGYYYKIITV